MDDELRLRLALCDTGHDFKEERSTNSDENNPDALGSNADAHRVTKQEMVREFCNFLSSHYGAMEDPCTLNNALGVLTDNNVTSFSGRGGMTFEQSVQSYFEFKTEYKDLLGSNNIQRISYQEILDDTITVMTDNLIGDDTTPHTQKILELYFDENYVPVSDESNIPQGIGNQLGYVQRNFNRIANFILRYMFPGVNIGAVQTYMTFDANPGYVNKLFLNIPQVLNLLMPQNFADSASSSSNQLAGRSFPVFPYNVKNQAEENIWNFNSNIFSQNIPPNVSVNIYIQEINPDQDYTVGNILDFKLCFQIILVDEEPFIVEKRFSSKQKQGASVNYLSKLIHVAEHNSNPDNPYIQYSTESPTVSTIINIGEQLDQIAIYLAGENPEDVRQIRVPLEREAISSVIIKILFDLKRSGDWEQANAAEFFRRDYPMTIYVSLDRLSALYSRILKNPTIWHNNTNLYLYRFPTEDIPSKLKLLYKIKNLLIEGKKIRDIYQLYANLNDLLNAISRAIEGEKHNAFTNISRTAKTNTNIYSIFIGLISTLLLRLKLEYTQHKIAEVLEVLGAIRVIAESVDATVSDMTPHYIFNFNYSDYLVELDRILTNIQNTEVLNAFIESMLLNPNSPLHVPSPPGDVVYTVEEWHDTFALKLETQLSQGNDDFEFFSSTPLSILINSNLEEIGNETISKAISLLNIEEKSWKYYENLTAFIEKLRSELFSEDSEDNFLFFIGGRVKNIKIPLLELDTTLFEANKKMGFQESLNRSALMLESALRKITSGREPRSNEVSVYKQLLENRNYGHVVEQMFPLIHPSTLIGTDAIAGATEEFMDQGLDEEAATAAAAVAAAEQLNNSIKNFLLFSTGFTPEITTQADNDRFSDLLGVGDRNSITFMTAYTNFRELLIDNGFEHFFITPEWPQSQRQEAILPLVDAARRQGLQQLPGYPIILPISYTTIIEERTPPMIGGGKEERLKQGRFMRQTRGRAAAAAAPPGRRSGRIASAAERRIEHIAESIAPRERRERAFERASPLQIFDLYDLLENIGGIASTYVMNDLNELKYVLQRDIRQLLVEHNFNYDWLIAFRLINVFIPCARSIYYCRGRDVNPGELLLDPALGVLDQTQLTTLKSFEENRNAIETTVEQIKNIYSSQLSSITTYTKSDQPDAVEDEENQLYGDSVNYYATDAYTYVPTDSSFFLTLLLSLRFNGENYDIDYEYIHEIYGDYYMKKNMTYDEVFGIKELDIMPLIIECITTLNTLKNTHIMDNRTIRDGDEKIKHIKLLLNYYILLVFTLLTNQSLMVRRPLNNLPDWNGEIIRLIRTINTLINTNIDNNIRIFNGRNNFLDIEAIPIGREVRELFRGGKKKKTRRKNLKKRKKSKKIRVKKYKKTKKRVIKKYKKTRKKKIM